jgi:P4 family phage/plasmid primase-like protien
MKATEILALGYRDLVSVIPPDARLAAGSAIKPEARGKSPGVRYASGAWGGYDWQHTNASAAEIEATGAGTGLRADYYPAVDVDIRDETLATVISNVVERVLPTGPVRVGAWPKRLYMFRLAAGENRFGRIQMFLTHGDERHLVEILAAGQQYVIQGVHPKTGQPYEWRKPLVRATELPTLTLDQAKGLMAAIAEECDMLGIEYTYSGDGNIAARTEVDQESLRLDNMSLLAEAVAAIPNADAFPSREDYIKFGYAVKAASQSDPERGFEIFAEWASRWTGGANEPGVVRADWDRMHGPYSVGAGYILDMAQQHGFNLAAHEFTALEPTPPPDGGDGLRPETRYSDMWLSDQFIRRFGGVVRYVEKWGSWFVFDKMSWVRDQRGQVPDMIKRICLETANSVEHMGATNAERKANGQLAKALSSSRTYDSVVKLSRLDSRVAALPGDFDNELDLLATPGGVFNLVTGELIEATPQQMLTQRTRVTPQRGPCPLWRKFLDDATGGDMAYQEYLQKLVGYCLTGHTREQKLFFFQGPGGRGKGTFLNTIEHVMGDLCATAQMTTFVASKNDRHPTELAAIAGARMVQAQETQAGRSWDEQRIKSLTGGDRITARFLYQDEFTYTPKFKLVFSGNHRPHIQSMDAAMRRRIRLIPFTREPLAVNLDLQNEMRRGELPAILYWALEGAVKWHRDGLKEPAVIQQATMGYFADEDAVGRWMEECCTEGDSGRATVSELFESWSAWCLREGETCGSVKRFSQEMAARGFNRVKVKGLMEYRGLRLQNAPAQTVVN